VSAAALGYLAIRTGANQLARRIAQLRSPRYLVALLLGAAYLWVALVRRRPGAEAEALPAAWVELGGALVLLALAAWSWIVGVERRVLAFSPAEVTFLFPAPITRRALVHYKLVRAQLVVLFNTLLWTVVLGRTSGAVPAPLRAAAVWTVLSTLSLHRLGASFVRTSIAEHGRAGLRRRAVSVLVVALVALGLAWVVAESLVPVLGAVRTDGRGVLDALAASAEAPVPRVLLWPVRALVRPLAALTIEQWLRAMPAAVLVLLAHYVWVIRSDEAFEEAAAEASLARLRRPAPRRRSAADRPVSPPLVRLSPRGRPATAIFWKNMTAALRRRRARDAALAFALLGGVAAIGSYRGPGSVSELAAALALTWTAFVFFLGPQWVRNDLRSDLRHVDLLRAAPLRGSEIVAAEALASAATLTLLELALIGFSYLALLGNDGLGLSLADRTALLAAALVLLPPVNAAAMLLQNGAALLYPSWVRIGQTMRGVEALGQNLLATGLSTALLVVLFAAPAGIGLGLARLAAPAGRGGGAALGAAAGIAVLLAELWAITRWLGGVFERLDRSTAGLEPAAE